MERDMGHHHINKVFFRFTSFLLFLFFLSFFLLLLFPVSRYEIIVIISISIININTNSVCRDRRIKLPTFMITRL